MATQMVRDAAESGFAEEMDLAVQTPPVAGDAVQARVRRALAAIAAGQPVVVVDDADRENEGDLVFAAEFATSELVAFTVRHTSGYVCVALQEDDCERLRLPPMHHTDEDRFRTAYRVTVDLIGTGTGISAAARARTIAALAAADAQPSQFSRPGHVVPLQAEEGGVLRRPGHTEAAVDLARLAGLRPAAALCAIVSADRPGEMARDTELIRFAAEHDLALLSITDLIAFRKRTEPQVVRAVTTSLPTRHGSFRAIGYREVTNGSEHVALVTGDIDDEIGVPVHVHEECLTGDVLGSMRCDCGAALDEAMAIVSEQGCGVVIYARPSGLARACGLLDPAVGVVRLAAAELAAWILTDLGVGSVRPVGWAEEVGAILESYGFHIEPGSEGLPTLRTAVG